MATIDVVLKRFESPDEVRTFEHGRFDVVNIGGMNIGRATYQPGWRWSEHVGPSQGLTRCAVEHVGLVLSGTATAAFDDGTVTELRPGALFHIPPTPHDSWVVGNEPYVSLHLLGAEHYADPTGCSLASLRILTRQIITAELAGWVVTSRREWRSSPCGRCRERFRTGGSYRTRRPDAS